MANPKRHCLDLPHTHNNGFYPYARYKGYLNGHLGMWEVVQAASSLDFSRVRVCFLGGSKFDLQDTP